MNEARPVQFLIYLVSGLVLGYLTFRSIMWGVWGAPVFSTHYIALMGSFALVAGAFISLANSNRGRIVSLAGLLSMGLLWIPGVVVLVPQHNSVISPTAYWVFLLYFSVIGFGLLYPKRWKWSVLTFAVLLIIAAGFIGVTATVRVRGGEFVRPSFAFYRWHPGEESLVIERDLYGWIDSETLTMLQQAGIRGTLECTGGSGPGSESHRVIVLAQRQPVRPYKLHYPRQGILIYAFDGEDWKMIPQNAPTFHTFATLEPEKSVTMLWEDVGGGRQGGAAITW